MSTLDEATPDVNQPANDWQIDYEKRFKDTQAELTRVKQQLSQQSQSQQWDLDAEARKQRIKENVLEPELQKLKGSLVADTEFNQLIDANPELKPYEKAIKELAQTKWIAYEDVIQEFGFGNVDKLAKAKDRSLLWDRWLDNQAPKTVFDLSPTEWKEFQAKYKWMWSLSEEKTLG